MPLYVLVIAGMLGFAALCIAAIILADWWLRRKDRKAHQARAEFIRPHLPREHQSRYAEALTPRDESYLMGDMGLALIMGRGDATQHAASDASSITPASGDCSHSDHVASYSTPDSSPPDCSSSDSGSGSW